MYNVIDIWLQKTMSWHDIIGIILGYLLIIFGLLDGTKYISFGHKIRKVKSSKAYSRKGMNFAWINCFVTVLYGVYIMDNYLAWSRIFILLAITYCWVEIYNFYNFRNRGLIHFKKPSIWVYLCNSMLPNRYRRHL